MTPRVWESIVRYGFVDSRIVRVNYKIGKDKYFFMWACALVRGETKIGMEDIKKHWKQMHEHTKYFEEGSKR